MSKVRCIFVGALTVSFFLPLYAQPPYQQGFPFSTGMYQICSSPTLVDLYGDGDKEVVIGGDTLGAPPCGRLFVVNANGQLLFRKSTDGYIRQSSPAVGDIDHNGNLEVLILDSQNKLHAWRSNGNLVPGFPVQLADSGPATYVPSPALYDVNNDGYLEIAIGIPQQTTSDNFFLINCIGSTIWSKKLQGRIYATAAFGDIDGDNMPEIFVGTREGTIVGESGHMYALKSSNGDAIWSYDFGLNGGVGSSSPAVGDINLDDTMEVIFGVSDHVNGGQGDLYVLNAVTGNIVWCKVDTLGHINASPVIANMSGDGTLEVVYADEPAEGLGNTGAVRVHSCDGTELIRFFPPLSWVNSCFCVADMDSDSEKEILFSTDLGWIYVIDSVGSCVSGYPFEAGGQVTYSSPAIADMDGDGDIEIAVGVTDTAAAQENKNSKVVVWDLPALYDPSSVEWGMFHHDMWHTGLYGCTLPGVTEVNNNEVVSIGLAAYPNPFSQKTNIKFQAPNTEFQTNSNSQTTLRIYDATGRLVKSFSYLTNQPFNQITWDGRDNNNQELHSGVYFCQLAANGEHSLSQKLIMIKCNDRGGANFQN